MWMLQDDASECEVHSKELGYESKQYFLVHALHPKGASKLYPYIKKTINWFPPVFMGL
jgi:hypothetical protein